MGRMLYLIVVSTLPILVIWITSFAFHGGWLAAWMFYGPVLAVIYPPIAVWMVCEDYRERGGKA